MTAKRLVFLLGLSAALGYSSACGGRAPIGGPDGPVTFTFSGTVKSAGAPLANVQVFLSGDATKTTVTDSQGNFSFAVVLGSNFTVTPYRESYVFTPSSYELGRSSRADLHFVASSENVTFGTLQVGDIAPDFIAVDQNGRTFSLYSLRGKVVLLDFSADWCGSCRAEAPQLEALYEQYKDQGFGAVTILTQGSAAAWASAFKVNHTVIEQGAAKWSTAYGAAFIPLNVVLDKTMTIRWKSRQDWDYEFDPAETIAVIKQYF